jgi:hypothetical protein
MRNIKTRAQRRRKPTPHGAGHRPGDGLDKQRLEHEREPGTEILWAPTDTFVDRGARGPAAVAARRPAWRSGPAAPVL